MSEHHKDINNSNEVAVNSVLTSSWPSCNALDDDIEIKPVKKETKIISVEGNIGSGKSTLVESLRKNYNGRCNVCFLQEPVDIWNNIRDVAGNSMITKFYNNVEKYSFSFQMMAYISRLSLLRDALKKDYDVIVVERSMYTDKMVFAKMLYHDNKMEDVEYQIYNKWFDEFVNDIPPIDIIYVKTSPTVSLERIKKRARHGETISLEYLQNCWTYHENWINDDCDTYRNKIVIQGDVDIEKDPDMLKVWLARCKIFIDGVIRS